MSQRLACSWCCKASCFISSHLAYVPRKGLKLSGRESEAHDTAQLSHSLIQFTCKSLTCHTHSSLKLCRKARVTRPQVRIHCNNILGSFATGLKERWSSACPVPPRPEEGSRKDAPNKSCLSLPRQEEILSMRSKHQDENKVHTANHRHMECAYAHGQHQSLDLRRTALVARELGRYNIHIPA